MQQALDDLMVTVAPLETLLRAIAHKYDYAINEVRSSVVDTQNMVCVLTHKCNHPYNDKFGEDAGGMYVIYRGQNVDTKMDKTLLNPEIPKYLLIQKGSIRRTPPVFMEKNLTTRDTYFFGATVVRVRLEDPVKRTFKVYFNPDTCPPSAPPSTMNFKPLYDAVQHKMKLKALITNGFLPVSNKTFGQGITMCHLFKQQTC
jgi:hypothetical protein